MQIKETKNSVDEFLLFLSIFCKKENSEKMDEKNRQTAAVILVDLNPEHLHRCVFQHFSDNISKITMIWNFFCSEKFTMSI